MPNKMNSVPNVEFMPSVMYVPRARDTASVERVHESISKFEENLEVYTARNGGSRDSGGKRGEATMQAIVAKAKPLNPDFFTLGGF